MTSLSRTPSSARIAAIGAVLVVVVLTSGSPVRIASAGEATPTPSGAAGEIASQLPPADLPSISEQGYRFALNADLDAEFDSVATEAPVYRITPTPLDADAAADLADRLDIGAEIEDRGGGTFAASGEGQLFVTPTLIQYLSTADATDGELPNDEEAVAFAREWLRRAALIPPDLGDGRVVSRTDLPGRVVVSFAPVEPAQVLAAYPGITVSLGPNGRVLEASSRWMGIERADLYRLRPAQDAWLRVEAGEAYLEVDLSESGITPGSEVKGTVEYTEIGLAYTTAGPPGGEQYLEPVYVFGGRLRIENTDQDLDVRAYVPALAVNDAPVGAIPAAPRV